MPSQDAKVVKVRNQKMIQYSKSENDVSHYIVLHLWKLNITRKIENLYHKG